MKVSYKMEMLEKVAEYVVSFDSKEAMDYISWCEYNELDPKNIGHEENQKHIYAIALTALDLKFEE